MTRTSFTVHLSEKEGTKLQSMKEENPTFSRNALIRLAISEYNIKRDQEDSRLDDDSYLILHAKHEINKLHKQMNPDWKRKKSLPYHFPEEYHDVANYTGFHGSAKHE